MKQRELWEELSYRLNAEEIRYVLADERGRRFLWRLFTELFQLDVTSFPQNAGIYALCGKQQAGRILLRACREFDLDKVQLAEREYYAATDRVRKLKEGMENG